MSGFLIVAAAMLAASAVETDVPAKPWARIAPDYPVACMPAAGETKAPQTVAVLFDVTKYGEVENVRVRESSDSCFDEAAVAAARGWRYKPRTVDGDPKPQTDIETTLSFVLNEPTQAEDFDARPAVRVPPRYPDNCAEKATPRESVHLQFDVAVDGKTENIRVLESTDACFRSAAVRAIENWRYRPKLVAGNPVPRPNVETVITFELGVSRRESPRLIMQGIYRAQKHLTQRKPDPAKTLAELAKLEAEHGAEFSSEDTTAFHQVRGAARLGIRDYRGALDDLKRVRAASPVNVEAIAETILKLEATIAAQDAREKEGAQAPAQNDVAPVQDADPTAAPAETAAEPQ